MGRGLRARLPCSNMRCVKLASEHQINTGSKKISTSKFKMLNVEPPTPVKAKMLYRR